MTRINGKICMYNKGKCTYIYIYTSYYPYKYMHIEVYTISAANRKIIKLKDQTFVLSINIALHRITTKSYACSYQDVESNRVS